MSKDNPFLLRKAVKTQESRDSNASRPALGPCLELGSCPVHWRAVVLPPWGDGQWPCCYDLERVWGSARTPHSERGSERDLKLGSLRQHYAH